jgi:hypothetical protein
MARLILVLEGTRVNNNMIHHIRLAARGIIWNRSLLSRQKSA